MTKELRELKKKYVRSIIKLGNSLAITFPQDWTKNTGIKEKSEISIYPIDNKTIVIRAFDKEKKTTIFKLDSKKWPKTLIKQSIISAFKLNVDEIYLKYYDDNQKELYELLIDLSREIIGIDFKSLREENEYLIKFLLDTSKTTLTSVLMDLADVFYNIIDDLISVNNKNNNSLFLSDIDKKYSMGTRILITGLSDYPITKSNNNMPYIRFLGDRVVLIYIRDFINESLNLQKLSKAVIKKYSKVLIKIPNLLKEIINIYNDFSLDSISEFSDYITNLQESLDNIKLDSALEDERELRNIFKYYLNSFKNFFDIGITRVIESEIGMA